MLTTGIEVTVKPTGKKIERLSLLSGGERSLAAVALLIVITHQKRTMEIADALYGVSMRADGISAVVGQRVSRDQAR